ncbi:hypothetical protein L6232_25855, partial [Shewanella sp. C31]|nr:hypothetical protein [Shewanella electrica]
FEVVSDVMMKRVAEVEGIYNESTSALLQPQRMEGGQYIKEIPESAKTACFFVTPKENDDVGTLVDYLEHFMLLKVNLVHIES